jgi:hypothetical protein
MEPILQIELSMSSDRNRQSWDAGPFCFGVRMG